MVGDGLIILRGSVKDNAAAAVELVARYAAQWNKDPDYGPLFESVESSDLKKDPDTKRLTFELTMKFKDTSPKPPPKPADAPEMKPTGKKSRWHCSRNSRWGSPAASRA